MQGRWQGSTWNAIPKILILFMNSLVNILQNDESYSSLWAVIFLVKWNIDNKISMCYYICKHLRTSTMNIKADFSRVKNRVDVKISQSMVKRGK